ncbi:MAG: mechanosensitive ion channel [Epsilonproteobacteria bacterium]|nr:mechanosensitive ion channel [Campylobacterota bacterium]
MIYRLIFFIFIQTTLFYGADINNTITTGNQEFYTKLEKNLDQNQTKDILNLQQTLLSKLKELSKNYREKNISIALPSNQQEYEDTFRSYLDESINKSKYHNQLLENQQNLILMRNQIKEDSKVDLTKELFYAFYNKSIDRLKKQILETKKHLDIYQNSLIHSIPNITFDIEENQKKLKNIDKSIQDIKEKEKILKLKIEQSKLINNEKNLKKLQDKIEEIRAKKQQLFRQKLKFNFLLFSQSLQNKDKKTFTYKQNMVNFIEKHHEAQYVLVKDDLKKLFRNMEKEILGTIKTFEGESSEEIKVQLLKVWDIVNQPLFFINKTPLSIFKLFIALFIFVIGFFVAKFYKHYIKNISSHSKSITESTQTLLANLGHYFIFLITLFIVLNVLGIDLSSIALVAGALSVGIGFGLQNIISNFVSGIILMLERSVKIGDYIEIDEDTRGLVTDIKMRSITVNTNSNIDITIPNQSLIENQVINWSMNDRIKRFEIPFGVAYGTSPQKVIEVVLKAVENTNSKNILKTKDRYTRVVMTEMGDSSVNFELFVWITGKDIFSPKRTTSKFLIVIYEALYENNIEIPFPQQDIHIRSIDSEITTILGKK